ncbi:MAG: penicillin-binding transpeptidase domain-containing protein [bacterium]
MKRNLRKIFGGIFKRSGREIDPDEVLLDAENLPKFDDSQLEGHFVKPISLKSILTLCLTFAVVIIIFSIKAFSLQVTHGADYREVSENNILRNTPIFAERGAILDRNGEELIWNEKSEDPSYLQRKYATTTGLAHVLGYVKYPSKDSSGFYYRDDYEGMDGIEKLWNNRIRGKNGLNIVETNALGKIVSQNMVEPAHQGENITLSIDSALSQKIFEELKSLAIKENYNGGSAVIMDIHTGEVLANVSYPEYDSQILVDGKDSATINKYLNDPYHPFLNKVVDGVYTPGSIVKPFMALAALTEGVIDPEKKIESTGSIELPNKYFPDQKTVFKDWKALGWVDMRHALAVSCDVYFYEVGGGYKDQKGLGISNIDKYFEMFDFGKPVNEPFFSGASGVIPSPDWKAKNFKGEEWTIGDTYHTAIGQYGFQISPIQMVRAIAAIASNGQFVMPTLEKRDTGVIEKTLQIPEANFQVVREGMRLAVKEGTAKPIDLPFVEIGAKSGTAEVGISKDNVNSWITGFFPYNQPKYAFLLMMERGPRTNTVGAGNAMGQVFQWMNVNKPEYFKEVLK